MMSEETTVAKNSNKKEDLTLRQLSTTLCRKIDIGTAILPKPLFVHDDETKNETKNGAEIGNATVECVDIPRCDDDNDDDINGDDSPDKETLYAKVVQSEFNSIVIEVNYYKYNDFIIASSSLLFIY